MASSPDPQASAADAANPFASLGAGMGFFQDWMKAAGSALPHLGAQAGAASPTASPWTMPTLDPEELDKRIQDLKTVQFWLEQNARMIGMTIQGMEVQRMTLSTLKGMNVSMDAVRDALKARAASSFVDPFAAAAPPPAPAPTPAPPPPEPPAPAATASASTGEDAPATEASELINPMRWWDTLTQQFTHLATSAAANVPAGLGAASTPASQGKPRGAAKRPASKKAKAAGKSASKPAAKRASPRTPRAT
jgi:hypothetical protein